MCHGAHVTIVIPQRGQAELTEGCVESLRRVEGNRWPVIVVDDGSGDESAERVRRANVPNCRVIEQTPLGVTAAWNAGLRAVETDNVILLNNDVQIHGPFIDRLLVPLRTRQAWIVGAEWRVEPLIPRSLRRRFPAHRLLAGWCLAFETSLWHRLGGFDEAMKIYWSDTDFQCRVAKSCGNQSPPIASAGPLPLRHLGHQTARHEPRRRTQWQADRAMFLKKWLADPSCSKSATSDASAARRPVRGR